MVKASGQIEQDLQSLQQRTEEMADALELLYEGYLKALSAASQRQLVLAAYHLCTQAYPDRFLALSWDKRNQLQQSLQALSAGIDKQLADQRDRAKKMSRRPQQHSGLEFLQRLLEARALESKLKKSSKSTRETSAETVGGEAGSAEQPLKDRASDLDSSSDGASDFFDGLSPHSRDRSSGHDSENTSGNASENTFNNQREDNDSDAGDWSSLEFIGEESRVEAGDLEDISREESFDEQLDSDDDFDFEMEVPAAEQRLSMDEEEDLLSALEGLARRSLGDQAASGEGQSDDETEAEEKPLVPIHLVKQQVLLEKAIRDVFASVSEKTNELLQKAEVMPSFPKALMAAAVDARGMGEPMSSVPNVVKVSVRVMQGEALMDSDDDDDDLSDRVRRAGRRAGRRGDRTKDRLSGRSSRSGEERIGKDAPRMRDRPSSRSSSREEPPIQKIIARDAMSIEALPELAAVSLRLSEVEFSDPTVSAWRSKLRQKLNALKKLGMQYKKTQRALETAQAEDAWRSSWTVHQPEDQPEAGE